MDKRLVDVFGTVIRETDLAILADCGDGEVWLPKSQLEEWPDVDCDGEIVMTEWIAEQKGLV